MIPTDNYGPVQRSAVIAQGMTAPRQESRLESIDKRLSDHQMRLSQLYARTSSLADRVIGVQPQPAERAGQSPKEVPGGMSRRLEMSCDELSMLIDAVGSQIERLESL